MAFQVLSRVPGGQSLYHGVQRRLTGSTRQTQDRLLGKIGQTLEYWKWLVANFSPARLAAATHLELGSGWLPSVPVTFHALGIPRQFLVDIAPHMQPEAVVETVEIFRAAAPRADFKFARLPAVPQRGQSLAATLEPLGMVYAAPYDGLVKKIAGTASFVTATGVLLHMNRATLLKCCRSLHGLLEPGGCFLAQQRLRQSFEGPHVRTPPFVSLPYSDWYWENIINSPLMSFNRLLAPDYKEVLEESGFEVVHFDVEPGGEKDFAQLEKVRVHGGFSRYTRADLAARNLFFVARKP